MEPDCVDARLRRTTIASGVRARLRESILDGSLMPGAALSENEISHRLGLSRTPVREAFIKLEEEGLIVVFPQYGSFVAPIRVADIHDSAFVREALECAALEGAIATLTPADATALEAILRVQKQHIAGDTAPFFAADEAMHAMLMRIAGHERAWLVVEAAKGQHDRVRRLIARDPVKRRSIFAEHRTIIDHVLARETVPAVAALRLHLRGVFRSVEIVMARHPEFFTPVGHTPKRPARPSNREVA